MPAYYTYFISSLPMLHFGMKPPFSSERFLKMCEGLISEQDIYILKNLPMRDGDFNPSAGHNPIIQGWLAFDAALRNELVKIRSQYKHVDPLKYLRQGPRADFLLGHIGLSAHRNPSLLEGEKSLDQARWEALDELQAGHYFDADFLLVYGYKLKLLERWDRINTADKTKLLEETSVKR